MVSDAHGGLVKAMEEAFPGGMWQGGSDSATQDREDASRPSGGGQTHFMRRALDLVRDTHKAKVHEDLRLVLQASRRERALEGQAPVEKHWRAKYPKLTATLEAHFESVLAVLNVPEGHRKRLRTTNHVERVNQELKRRGRTIRI